MARSTAEKPAERACYMTTMHLPSPLTGKFNLSSSEAISLLGSVRLFQRLRYHGWLVPLAPSRDALFPVSRLLAVQRRMEAGEMPPLLPCEVRARERRVAERVA